MAQKVNKLKERLSTTKRMLRQLKEERSAENMIDSAIIVKNGVSCGADHAAVNDIEIEFAEQEGTAVQIHHDGSISNCQAGQIVNLEDIAADVSDIRLFHSYAKPYSAAATVCKPVQMYECDYCSYKTPKKDNLVKHMISCLSLKVLDENCPVCGKSFTYDGLRLHLRYYANGKNIAKNRHAQYTPREHVTMLKYHKMRKIK